jgi:hypothetical protein
MPHDVRAGQCDHLLLVRPLAVNIIERELRNKIEDDWMNALMVCYTEKEIFKPLDDETIT